MVSGPRWMVFVGSLFCALLPSHGHAQEKDREPPQAQIDEYNANRPKTIVELQQFRETTSIPIENDAGERGTATLINLNPRINSWFLLKLQWADGRGGGTYHIENPEPTAQTVRLDPERPGGIVIVTPEKGAPCDLWSGSAVPGLISASASGAPYAPICGDRLYLRNKTTGHKSSKELVTDFLRDHVWEGEKITNFVKEKFFRDAFLKTSEVIQGEVAGTGASSKPPGAPPHLLIDAHDEDSFLIPAGLGIELGNGAATKVLAGSWYPAKDLPGVFVAAIQPDMVSEDILRSERIRVAPLDEIESRALVYLVAFNLGTFEAGFAMGTDHPRVDWSDRALESVRDNSLPGPDGIGTVEPLVNTGLLSPAHAERVVATFAGGFRRYHGAFRWGELALKNHGSHYGFLENGTLMSKLQPGLATFIVYDDGTVDLKTWTDRDNGDLERIRHARQNGVPLVEYDEATGTSRPGDRVHSWGLGNWSGSQEKQYRTLRAGLCLQEHEGDRFLVFGYFSSATPSAMARVFQAANCRTAMLLDMNALEHTYLAAYRREDSKIRTEHLIEGMSELDKAAGGRLVPRFVGFPDNRDFFYLLRRTDR